MDTEYTHIKDPNARIGWFTTSESPNRRLTNEYVTRATYHLLECMATQSPGFYGAQVRISKSGRVIGKMLLTKIRRRYGASNSSEEILSNATFIDTVTLGENPNAPLDNSLTANSGEIADPDDPDGLRIPYTYGGHKILNSEIFFALFSGIAHVAQIGDLHPLDYIDAISASRNLAVHMGGGGEPGTQLTTTLIKITLETLYVHLYSEERRFEDIDFSVSWQGKKYADGFVMDLGPPVVGGNNGTGLTATS